MKSSPFPFRRGRFAVSLRVARTSPAAASLLLAAVLLSGFFATVSLAQSPAPIPMERPANLPSLGDFDQDRRGTNYHPRSGSREPRFPDRATGPFYLPVLLPVLGSVPGANPEILAAGYPRESAGEPFFMAKGNLAANQRLPDRHADQLAGYRTARLTLLTELRAGLDHVRSVPAAARAGVLADLAARQTPLLLELEAEAESIRHDLTHTELLKDTADDIGMLVPVGEKPWLEQDLAAIRRLLSAAHFRNGFSPDQRRLLEEMAQECRLGIESDRGGRSVFFWPAGARIPVPAGLAPGMAEKFEEFQRRKTALKADLRAALERDRKKVFNFDYSYRFERLAAAQAPRFAELDALADELRPALAALPAAGENPATALPADFTHQLTQLAERLADLQRDLRAKLAEFSAALPADHVALTPLPDGMAIIVATSNDLPADRAAVLARIKACNDEVVARFADLAAQRNRVRDGLVRHQSAHPGANPGQTADQLTAQFLAAHRARAYRERQSDYAAAILASGLSPAQRRLLLAATAADSVQPAAPDVAFLSANPPR